MEVGIGECRGEGRYELGGWRTFLAPKAALVHALFEMGDGRPWRLSATRAARGELRIEAWPLRVGASPGNQLCTNRVDRFQRHVRDRELQ